MFGGIAWLFAQKRPFVHNLVWSLDFLECLFAILAECSQFFLRSFFFKFKRKSITLLVGRRGVRGTKVVDKEFVNKKIGVSFFLSSNSVDLDLAMPNCRQFAIVSLGALSFSSLCS